jgi:hypothetical protein
MRSVNFSDILHASLQLCGLDRNLTTPDRFAMVRDLASMRLRTIWESNEWTDLKVLTKCSVNLVDERRIVGFDQSIGQVLTIWDKDPMAKTTSQKDFELINNVINLRDKQSSEVWVESRKESPRLYGDAWSTGVSYRPKAQVYYDSGSESGSLVPVAGYPVQGDFYVYTGTTPSGTGSIPTIGSWERIQIPKLFTNALIHGVHADFRRSTNELEAAQAAEADYAKALDSALDQTLRQQGSTRPINFRNY